MLLTYNYVIIIIMTINKNIVQKFKLISFLRITIFVNKILVELEKRTEFKLSDKDIFEVKL